MFSSYSSKHRVLGYGRDHQEAEAELALHIARQDINAPEARIYLSRREELYPWNPTNDILQIRGITAIVRDGNTLTNARTGDRNQLVLEPYTQYLNLFPLLGDFLSFSDFTCCVKPEIDKFFRAISPVYNTLEDFPFLQPGYIGTAVDITHYGHRCFSCTTQSPNEMLVSNGQQLVSVGIPNGASVDGMLAYGFAKLGVIYDGKNVRLCQNAPKHSVT